MLVKKAYKFCIAPDTDQQVLLARTFGCCRFVWNQLLDSTQKEYELFQQNPELPKPTVSGFGLVNKLPFLKAEYEWLSEVSSVALQQKCLDLGVAYSNFFNQKARYPRFKKKQHQQSFRLMSNGFTIKDGNLFIAKCKTPIKVYWSRELPSTPSQVTLTKTPDGKYYVSFLCEVVPTKTSGTKVTGVDLGLKTLAALSDGTVIENPRFLRKQEKRLIKIQRSYSRKRRGSSNANKHRIKLAKLHAKIANGRIDYLHKETRKLVNENQVIGLEFLKVVNMVKNHSLAKSIMDVSWGRFKTFLEYKVKESQHCSLVIVDPFFPSTQTCSACGHRLTGEAKLTLKDRQWVCPTCQSQHDRDQNAAINLANEAYQWFAKNNCKGVIVIAPCSKTAA